MTLAAVLAALAAVAGAGLAALFIHDRWFSNDSIIRNFPVIGHFRYLLIELGPKLRQYIVADNREELPFNRDERDWIYRSANGENNYFGFGTDDQILSIGYPVIKHAMFPHGEESFTGSAHDVRQEVPAARTLGEVHSRPKAWKPTSIVNVSAMSYGALGAHATEALNRGAKLMAVTTTRVRAHLAIATSSAPTSYQIGPATSAAAISTAVSHGEAARHARRGAGGARHRTSCRGRSREKAASAGTQVGGDRRDSPRPSRPGLHQPNNHTAFADVPGLIRFVEEVAAATGMAVGIKSAVGRTNFGRAGAGHEGVSHGRLDHDRRRRGRHRRDRWSSRITCRCHLVVSACVSDLLGHGRSRDVDRLREDFPIARSSRSV